MPLNIGLMMFNPEPWRFFPAMQIDVIWLPKEGPGGNKFSEKIFKDPIPRMTRDALDCIARTLIFDTVIKHPDRAEATRVANFPFATIEETVVNAVYHRAYDTREPVEVRIETTDLFVISYPGPDRSVQLAQLRSRQARPRCYRNRRIGEFLKELKFTEGRATGIPKIVQAMQRNGSPPAEFEFDENHSYFLVRLPIHPTALAAADTAPGDEPRAVNTQTTQEKVLRLIKSHPAITRQELAVKLGLTPDGIKYPSAKNEIGRSDSACWGHQVGSPGKSKIIATHAYPIRARSCFNAKHLPKINNSTRQGVHPCAPSSPA